MADTAQGRYREQNLAIIQFNINKKTEPEILEWLQRQANKSGYIKQLIRKDMARAARAAARKAQNK